MLLKIQNIDILDSKIIYNSNDILRIKEEDSLPAIAVGFNDIAGTGLFGSEYIVSSYGVKNLDFHFGIGWGSLNNISGNYKNPLGYIYDDFNFRPSEVVSTGGQFELSKYFSGRVSPFYGLSYAHGDNLIFKFEKDNFLTNEEYIELIWN